MTAYAPGELKRLYWLDEVTHGTTPATAPQYGGEVQSVTPSFEPHQSFEVLSDAKQFSPAACVFEQIDAGFKIRSYARINASGYDWRDPLLRGALGAVGGISALGRLPSLSFLIELTRSTTYGRYLFNGCKVDKLVLTADRPGAKLLFEADVMAQYMTKCTGSPPATVAGLQSLTLGTYEAVPTSALLQWKAPFTLNTGTPRTIYPQNWKLTIENHLVRQGESKTGADAAQYALTGQLHEGVQDVTFEADVYLEDLAAFDEMLANQAITSLATTIGGYTVTLGLGRYVVDSGALPELKQDVMTQHLKMKFSTLTVA